MANVDSSDRRIRKPAGGIAGALRPALAACSATLSMLAAGAAATAATAAAAQSVAPAASDNAQQAALQAAPAAAAASAGMAVVWAAADVRFVYAVVVIVLLASVVSLLMVRSALTASLWSFADAMSEPTETTAAERDAAGNTVAVTLMRASSSRMLALMGAVVILLMFLGFGAVALFSFATTGDLPPAMDRVVHFLLAGMTLFAPYAVNRFAKLFENLAQRGR